ncbi:MAG: hypothetical protein V7L01_32495 [Nostoc sp.]
MIHKNNFTELDQSPVLNLQNAIKIFCDVKSDIQSPQIWLSSGITQEIKPELNDLNYRPGAFVPKEPWRKPSPTEYCYLHANKSLSQIVSWDSSLHIGLCSFPDRVLAPFIAILEELEAISKATLNEYKTIFRHPLWENGLTEIIKHLQIYRLAYNRPEVISFQVTQPGLKTVTPKVISIITQPELKTAIKDDSINPSENLLLGMHLDGWDRESLRLKYKSRNRLCINLGREDRFFLFINLTLIDMLNALGLPDKEIYEDYQETYIRDEFMNRYPDYPVVKLKVAPGEAYIAPTDNLIHDGSSLGKQYPDITLAFLGYFGIPSQQN